MSFLNEGKNKTAISLEISFLDFDIAGIIFANEIKLRQRYSWRCFPKGNEKGYRDVAGDIFSRLRYGW
jgi:hypothetical protein